VVMWHSLDGSRHSSSEQLRRRIESTAPWAFGASLVVNQDRSPDAEPLLLNVDGDCHVKHGPWRTVAR
jgi:hypothetical protein